MINLQTEWDNYHVILIPNCFKSRYMFKFHIIMVINCNCHASNIRDAHSHINNVYYWFFIFILLLIFEMLMGKLRFKKSKRKGC